MSVQGRELAVRPHGGEGLAAGRGLPSPADGERPWCVTASCPEPAAGPVCDTAAGDATALGEALLGADEDTALVLERLAEQEELVAFHREELHQTNQGVLALHAELDAAGRAQREAFAAEHAARREAEDARRRLTFLADASATLTASLNHEEIARLLPELLVPRYARTADVWLFDAEDERVSSVPRAAAAVIAARTGRPQYAAAHPGVCPGWTTSRRRRCIPAGPCCACRCRPAARRWAS